MNETIPPARDTVWRRVPITPKFAGAVGEILTVGPIKDIPPLLFSHYIQVGRFLQLLLLILFTIDGRRRRVTVGEQR